MNRPWNPSAVAVLRLAAAFVVTPVVAGVVMFIIDVGLSYSGIHVFNGTPYNPVDAAIGLALGVTIIGFGVTGAAVPAVLWMASRGRLSLRNVLLLGAALGNVPFAAIVVSILVVQVVNGTLSHDVARLWDGLYGTVRAIALGLLIGPASAAVFWVIGVSGTGRAHSRA